MISGLVMHLAVLAQSCECPLWRLQILAELNGLRSRPFFMAKWTAESQLFAVRKAPVWMMDACRWEPWLDTETGLSPIATLATLATQIPNAKLQTNAFNWTATHVLRC